MAALNEIGSDAEDPATVEEQLAIQELLERERAAERDMQNRLQRCKWLRLDQSLWGAQWSRARVASEPGGNRSFPTLPVAADGEECCPVCLYPPLPQLRMVLGCCNTKICQRCVAPLSCCPICKSRLVAQRHGNPDGPPRSQGDEVYCMQRRQTGACKCPPITHVVTAGDSAFSIALRYRTTTDQLLRANLMRGTGPSELAARANVIIPVCMVPCSFVLTPDHILEENQKASSVLRFQKTTRASRQEAMFYLEDANWSLQLALQAHSDDSDWERQQQNTEPMRHQQPHGASAPIHQVLRVAS